MNIAETLNSCKEQMQKIVGTLDREVTEAARAGRPIHVVELAIWAQVLAIGKAALTQFLALQGDGDMGDTQPAPDGGTWQRLEERHERRYRSIFGEFRLVRVVYGSREGQKIEFVPLDNRLQLPNGVFSYVLQDWSQGLCAESAFGQVAATLARIFEEKVPVDSLEHMNVQMAERVDAYRENRPVPAAASEGALLVVSGDCKGVVMRREEDDPAPAAHRTKGEKASKKQMATVAAVYTVDPHLRTAEDVVAALFRDRETKPPPRPEPQNKQVWAQLSREDGDKTISSIDVVYEQMMEEIIVRNRQEHRWLRPIIYLSDGQDALWEARARHLPPGVDILEFLHVTPRLWQAAHVFCGEGSDAAEPFVRERCLRLLQGGVDGVIRGFREMATKRGLTGNKKKTIATICDYFEKNRERMRYDEYLRAGYPIASGAVEGACRHLVKDRMERAGMHWRPEGAQAMLSVRSVYVNGDWEGYQTYRIECEARELYPHRHLVEGPRYAMAI